MKLPVLTVFGWAISHGISEEPRLSLDPNPRIRAGEAIYAAQNGDRATESVRIDQFEAILKKRTLDVEPMPGKEASAVLSALATKYKKKYGEDLPLFVSVDLITARSKKKDAGGGASVFPGTSVPVPGELGAATIGGRLYNVPIREITRFYANLLGCSVEVRHGMILFQMPRK